MLQQEADYRVTFRIMLNNSLGENNAYLIPYRGGSAVVEKSDQSRAVHFGSEDFYWSAEDRWLG